MFQPNNAPPAAAPAPGPGGPGGPGGPPQAGGVPPELAQHVNPDNKIQMLLLQRVDSLTTQDAQQFFANIKPPALAVLKKIMPELGFMLDAMTQQMSGGQGGAPMPAPGGGAPPQPTPQGLPQPGMARPTTRLGQF